MMRIRVKNLSPTPDPARLANVERALGITFPATYVQTLGRINGGEPETNTFVVTPGVLESGVNEFVDVERIPEEFKLGGFEELDGVVPVAFAEGGNYVCLKVAGQDAGSIHFWDHEDADPATQLIRLAGSMDEFLDRIAPFDVSSVKLAPGQVVSGWIDPEFLKELKGG